MSNKKVYNCVSVDYTHVLNLSMNLGLNLICIFLCSEFIVLLLILTLKNAYFESF